MEIHFWETGGIGKKRIQVKGYHQLKPIQFFGIHGAIKKDGELLRHDVRIGNKWTYLTDEEKVTWIADAKAKITEVLSKA